MVKKKEVKEDVVIKNVKKDVVKEVKQETKEEQYHRLVNEIKSVLLSNGALKRGGSKVRQQHAHEVASFTSVLDDINKIGKEIGMPPIGLGHLRG